MHPGRSCRLRPLLTPILLAVALSAVTAVRAPATRAGIDCEVRNVSASLTYRSLQAAETDSSDGDELEVRGICEGPVVIGTDITMIGKVSSRGAPLLTGVESVRVVEIDENATVTIKSLEIAYGFVDDANGAEGGGILNRGTLTLRNVVVAENDAEQGAGIANLGTLLIDGASQIRNNRATVGGGGIYSKGKLTIGGTAAIFQNSALFGGGVVQSVGVFGGRPPMTMRDATAVRHNTAVNGGGIFIDGGRVLLKGMATVKGNTATGRDSIEAGGIHDSGGVLTLEGQASVRGNTGPVGGISATEGESRPRVTLKHSSVVRANVVNTGGINLRSGDLIMRGSSAVRGHTTRPSVATVVVSSIESSVAATFTMEDKSSVTGNQVSSGWAAVARNACPGSPVPVFTGVKARTTGNTPRNVLTACL